MNEKTQENINKIKELVNKIKEFDGQKIGHDVDRVILQYCSEIHDLSDGEVRIDFNSIDTDVVSGTYHTVLLCDKDIKDAINSSSSNNNTEQNTNNSNPSNNNTDNTNTNNTNNTDNTNNSSP